jgi:hypothetical protein
LLRELEDAKAYDHPAYEQMNKVLTSHFTKRQVPNLKRYNHGEGPYFNKEIYVGMQGESEFTVGGVLEHWTCEKRNSVI